MFFRIKKIKGKEYSYVVESEWSRKGSRQKVKGYLGKVYRFSLLNEVDFLSYSKIENLQYYIDNNDKNKIINDLVEWEIYRFSISKKEFSINLNNAKIQKNNKNVVFLINEGFMCSYTLRNLFEFKSESDEQIDGYRFARAFVEAGIKVPQEIFVAIFGKLYKS